MFDTFRQTMTWVHTWLGLVLGYVLMIAFFFGALSVFDREIDRWALPQTRFAPHAMPSYDGMLAPTLAAIAPAPAERAAAEARIGRALPAHPQVMQFGAYTTHRDPTLSLFVEFKVDNPRDPSDHVHGFATVDPRDGRVLKASEFRLGTEFFYPLHFSLHLSWANLGIWIVGVSALCMLIALVSGVVVHRRLWQEFFTLRPRTNPRRVTLDLHNLSGVVALPFHFMFALTGLIVFAVVYFPLEQTPLRELAQAHAGRQAAQLGLPLEPAGVAAELASVDAMVGEAKRRWAARGMAGEVGLLTVSHVGDRNSYVSLHRAGGDRVSLVGQAIHFEGATGAVLYEEPPPTAVAAVHDFLVGLHLQHFQHWWLRFLYLLGGLCGAVCIATGLLFFVEKRKRQHTRRGRHGARVADALAVTAVTGIVIATCAAMAATWILPADLAQRGLWQPWVFWLSLWLSGVHAAIASAASARGGLSPAWRQQCWAIGALALLAVILNWVQTGDHLLRTLSTGNFSVAGVDAALLLAALAALVAARRLGATARRRVGADGSADPRLQLTRLANGEITGGGARG